MDATQIQGCTRTIELIDLHPRRAGFLTEVVEGLSRPQKELSAKYFYDQRGSELFEAITRLPEYYLTRTEISILNENVAEIAELLGSRFALIEYGSGSSTKVRILLDHVGPETVYMPVDISEIHLRESAEALAVDYPHLQIIAVCADYTAQFEIPESTRYDKKVVFFPGSTIGNLEPASAHEFLRDTARALKAGDALLIGVDLRKDEQRLHAAYNDAAGVTAAFNRNILTHVNSELGAAFDENQFEHVAFYNAAEGRIEMHLRSLVEQSIVVGSTKFSFAAGETIHTENSYKYTVEGFHALLEGTDFRATKVWTDAEQLFSVHYLQVI